MRNNVRIGTPCGLHTPPERSLLGTTLLNPDVVCRLLTLALDTQGVVAEQLQHMMRARLRRLLSSPNMASELMEIQSLLRDGPHRLSDILSLMAENRLQVRRDGPEDSRLGRTCRRSPTGSPSV